jgi:hypothetical protein
MIDPIENETWVIETGDLDTAEDVYSGFNLDARWLAECVEDTLAKASENKPMDATWRIDRFNF